MVAHLIGRSGMGGVLPHGGNGFGGQFVYGGVELGSFPHHIGNHLSADGFADSFRYQFPSPSGDAYSAGAGPSRGVKMLAG